MAGGARRERDEGDGVSFDLAATDLRHRLKRPDLKLLSFDTRDPIAVDTKARYTPPPGRARKELVSPVSAKKAPGDRSPRPWFALGLAHSVGAAVALAAATVLGGDGAVGVRRDPSSIGVGQDK